MAALSTAVSVTLSAAASFAASSLRLPARAVSEGREALRVNVHICEWFEVWGSGFRHWAGPAGLCRKSQVDSGRGRVYELVIARRVGGLAGAAHQARAMRSTREATLGVYLVLMYAMAAWSQRLS
eukprot:4421124-Prymnesium_polylepis.1